MKGRDLSLDVIRILACAFVILMHSPIPSNNVNGSFLITLGYFTAPSIGLFFMVSGALLIPVKTDYLTFLRRRLGKIVIPVLLWTTVYLALNIYYSKSEINIFQSIVSIPFSAQGHGVLWFIYTLIGLYLLAPILSAWTDKAKDREIKFVLLLWGVTLCYPVLTMYLKINMGTSGILYYFSGYAGYFLLGYALKNGKLQLRLPVCFIISLTGLITLYVLKRMEIEFDFFSLFWYESIFIVALCCVYWYCLRRIASFIKNKEFILIITTISNVSFGIYLVHILIMRYWLWKTNFVNSISNYLVQTIMIATLTLLLSTCVCICLSKLKIVKLAIGICSRNK